jgi:hypothetical protein
MLSTSLKIRIVIALVLLAGGVAAHQHPEAVSSIVDSAAGWVGFKSTVLQAVIVEESSDRSKLPHAQIVAILKASSIGIKVIDKDVIGPDGKTPAELLPFLKAAEGKQLPQLTRKWSNGRTTSVALPATFEKLKEAK